MEKGKFGFRIGPDFKRPENNEIQRLKQYGTPPLSDGLNKFNAVDPQIKPVRSDIKIAGPALTVRVRPADNLMIHKAISMAREGDVIVVDTCGCRNYSVLGDLMATTLTEKKIAGIVVDGGVRDIGELKEKGYPVFARFVTPAVGDKDGPGEINYPICCGGVPVMPGDYIVGDQNGVVVIPPDQAEGIIANTDKKLIYEAQRIMDIKNGAYDKPDIDEKLRDANVI